MSSSSGYGNAAAPSFIPLVIPTFSMGSYEPLSPLSTAPSGPNVNDGTRTIVVTTSATSVTEITTCPPTVTPCPSSYSSLSTYTTAFITTLYYCGDLPCSVATQSTSTILSTDFVTYTTTITGVGFTTTETLTSASVSTSYSCAGGCYALPTLPLAPEPSYLYQSTSTILTTEGSGLVSTIYSCNGGCNGAPIPAPTDDRSVVCERRVRKRTVILG